LCNSDFEQFLNVTPPSGFSWFPQANIPCWNTTASDGMIEIWHSGFGLVPAHSGNYFAEINATQNATLYQTFSATATQTVIVSFWHRGRYPGIDVMKVAIVAPDGTITSLGTYSDNNTPFVESSLMTSTAMDRNRPMNLYFRTGQSTYPVQRPGQLQLAQTAAIVSTTWPPGPTQLLKDNWADGYKQLRLIRELTR
jgi:hypothetical protein